MFNRKFFSTRTALFFLTALTAWTGVAAATPDFYGVKMKSEEFAQNIFLKENNRIPDFTNNRPGTDKRIYAYGYVSSTIGGGKGLALQVFNHSEEPIATEKLFRELTLVTWSGKRYDRSEAEMMLSRDSLGPGEDATFNFKFPGIRVAKEEVKMIICTFDMGETSIFLFPLETTAAPPPVARRTGKLFDVFKWHAKPPAAKKEVPKKPGGPAKTEAAKPAPAKQCVTPIKAVQSVFRALGETFKKNPGQGGAAKAEAAKTPPAPPASAKTESPAPPEPDQKMPPSYPLVKASQVIEGVAYNFSPNFRKEVQDAQKEVEKVIYHDRPWALEGPDKNAPHLEMLAPFADIPRYEAKVIHVNTDYGFVVVDAGFQDGLDKNVILDVLRNGRTIGKVMVTKPREKISGAIILPEWRTKDAIETGDLVGVSP